MAITASDIHNQSFSIDRKGYDVDEVDVFLEHVAEEIDALNAQVSDLQEQQNSARFAGFETAVMEVAPAPAPAQPAVAQDESEKDARIAELERQLAEKRADGNAIAQALIIAQRSADDLLARANQQADEIVAKARQEAQEIADQAEAERAQVQEQIAKLEQDCEAMCASYQEILKSFISDSTAKLSEVGEISLKNAARMRSRSVSAWAPAQLQPDQPVAVIEPGVSKAAVVDVDQTIAAPVVSAPMGKDLSGFGDAAVDDFDFDDLD